jgi:hypothetical protein
MTQGRQEQQLNLLFKAMPVVLSAVSFIGGILIALVTASFWYGKNVATVEYVDAKHNQLVQMVKESIEALTKYADRVAIDARTQAYDHSDMNKKDALAEVKAQSSDIKALGAKQDILLDTVRTIQNQMFEQRKR